MPQSGTLSARKQLFSSRQELTVPTVLTQADVGRTFLVNLSAPGEITLPVIAGVPPTDENSNDGSTGVGNGGSITIIKVGGSTITVGFPVPARPIDSEVAAVRDTYNDGNEGALTLASDGDWVILVSDGVKANPADWAQIRSNF